MSRPGRRAFISNLAFACANALAEPVQHTLVCVFLRGGADTLNMIVPYGDDDYYKARPNISIPKPGKGNGAALELDDFYGFHPKLASLLPLFADGRLGVIQGVGTDNLSGSHFECQDQMEHGEAYKKIIGSGWLGRHLRSKQLENTPLRAVAVGALMPESLRGAPSVSVIQSIDEIKIKAPSGNPQAVTRALATMYDASAGLLSLPGENTLELLARIDNIRNKPYKPLGKAIYPNDEFGKGLKEIARLVKADVGLEIACLDVDGWDTHFVQGQSDGLQAAFISQLGSGLAAFDADLGEHKGKVTVLVMTEFGRRIYENVSLGTDHGRGFAMIAIGDRIKGGKVHGKWPGLAENKFDLLGPGGLEITIDYRNVLAEVLTNIMCNNSVADVFPGMTIQPVGFTKV